MENADDRARNTHKVGERSFVSDHTSPGNVAPRRRRVWGRRRAAFRLPHSRTTTCHEEYAFFIGWMFGLIALKYQNKTVSAFETHLTSIGAFFITMCAYCLAKYIAKNHAPNYSEILSRVSDTLAALSSVALASISLPSSVSSLIMFVIWGIWIVIEARCLIQNIFQWFYQGIENVVFVQVFNVYRRFMRRRLMEQQPPPV